MRALVVDPSAEARGDLKDLLEAAGVDVRAVPAAEDALRVLEEEAADVLLVEHLLPGTSGPELLATLRARGEDLAVILMSALPTVPAVVRAMREGATDYLQKPIDPAALEAALAGALGPRPLPRPLPRVGAVGAPTDPAPRLVGTSACIENVKALIRAAARTTSAVFIHGPSGTGKEVVAESIHELSARARGPFVPVNCGALPEGLAEGELFGAERGAYTGADTGRGGLIRSAAGGTLFLDEIGEMAPALQVKLLRVLQKRSVRRVGGTREEPVDVRVIAATNRDPEVALADGSLREDLYFRLAVIKIALEPLHRRPEDVEPVAQALLASLRERYGSGPSTLGPAALAALQRHPWRGNVRELENVLDLVFAMETGGETIELGHLPEEIAARVDAEAEPLAAPPVAAPPPPAAGFPTLREAERDLITRAMGEAAGNKARAARLLGVSRPYLYRRLAELELPGADPEALAALDGPEAP